MTESREQSSRAFPPVQSRIPMLRAVGVGKSFPVAGGRLTVLRDVAFHADRGESVAIVGPSGSGKTTLLGICAGLDNPDEGEVWLAGERLAGLDEDARADLRNRKIGFVFQSFQLIPTLTALENVMVPLELRGQKRGAPAAGDLLAQVGLGDRLHHYPAQLSGGEQQRVALARAFIHQPEILFADEPTGNLDRETSEPIVEMLFALKQSHATCLVLITHDAELARRADRRVVMRGGRVITQG